MISHPLTKQLIEIFKIVTLYKITAKIYKKFEGL